MEDAEEISNAIEAARSGLGLPLRWQAGTGRYRRNEYAPCRFGAYAVIVYKPWFTGYYVPLFYPDLQPKPFDVNIYIARRDENLMHNRFKFVEEGKAACEQHLLTGIWPYQLDLWSYNTRKSAAARADVPDASGHGLSKPEKAVPDA